MMVSPRTRIIVARMTAGLRYALCEKEIADNLYDERLNFFQKEDDARRANRLYTEEDRRIFSGKNNRAQIRSALGCRISIELKKQGLPKLEKPNSVALELLGCKISNFFLHLERQFSEGMGWHNFGKWHIDHIVPCSSFDFRVSENLKLCFHFSNTQPLWASENISKGNRI